MDRGAVDSFVSRSQSVLRDSPEMGVRNTQLRLVEPFLAVLDWDVRSGDVEAAYEAGNGTVVDYALLVGSTPAVFVAVEPASDPVSVDERRSLLAAMRASNVPRGIHTNGRTFVLVAASGDRTQDAPDDPAEGSSSGDYETIQLELDALPEHLSALEAVSFESAQALSSSGRRRAAQRLVTADEDAVDAVTETIVELCGVDVTDDVEPLVRQFLHALVDDLAPNLDPASLDRDGGRVSGGDPLDEGDGDSRSAVGSRAGTTSGATTDSTPSSEQTTRGDTTQTDEEDAARNVDTSPTEVRDGPTNGNVARTSAKAASAGDESPPGDGETGARQGNSEAVASSAAADTEYVIRFFEDGRSVAAVGNPSVDSAMAQAIEYLLRERGLGHRLQFPYTPGDDGTAFLHRAPRHPDGREMDPWRDLDELALYTGQTVSVKQERVRTLAERVGLRVMFSGDWP